MKYSKENMVTICLICLSSALLALAYCYPWTADTYPPNPPISLPFSMYKAGAKIETEVRIVERYSYSFTLSFLYRDQADFARMKKLTGDRYVNAGIPIPLSLTIFKLDANGQHLLFTKEISEFPTYAWGGSIDKKIVDVFLETGQYAIRVECLQDIPELQDTKMNFVLVKNYRK